MGNIFGFLLYIIFIFLAWLLKGRSGCGGLLGDTTPQASMKLSPPHRSPALPCRDPPLPLPCLSSPVRAAGMAGTANSPGPSE